MKNRFLCSLLLAFCCLCSSVVSAQTAPAKWVFLGFLISEKVKGCVNNPNTREEGHWLPYDQGYSSAYEALKTSVKAKYNVQYLTIKQVTVKVGEPKVIALIEKTWTCGGKNLSFYDGKDEADIMAKAEADKKMYSEIASYRQIYLLDCPTEIAKQTGKPVAAAGGASWAKATNTDYAGLAANYLYVPKDNGGFTLVRLKNTRPNVVAKITFLLPGNKTQTETIEPNTVLTTRVNATNFSVEVTYEPFKPGDSSFDVIEWTKKKVQDYITEEEGKSKSRTTGIGVRG